MPVVKCPHCGVEIEFEGNKFRPFCSERCKLLDLGDWADERFRLPVESSGLTEDDLARLEREMEEKER